MLLAANNLAAVIVDVLRREDDVELTVLALRCVRELLETEERMATQGEDEVNQFGSELIGKYNIKSIVERMCYHPYESVSELASSIADDFFLPKTSLLMLF